MKFNLFFIFLIIISKISAINKDKFCQIFENSKEESLLLVKILKHIY